jgi:electron transfer flavoprotein beta subunit
MNIYVCVSHVPDTTSKVNVGPDGKHIDQEGVTYILNPYDEYGVETALQLKEAHGGEVTAVCVGSDVVKETIRKALAMGVDKGLHVKDDAMRDSFGTAKAISGAIMDRSPDVIVCGRQSIDYDSWQMASLLGEMMSIPSISVVSKLEVNDGNTVRAERDIEGGKETIEAKLPAVISVQKGIYNPRYPKLQGIMQAKKKPIEEVEPAAWENFVETTVMDKPKIKAAGKVIGTDASSAAELVRLLHEEAKVI